MKYDSFIFDLDGTICNTLKDIAHSVNYSLKKHHYPTHKLNKFKSFVGNGSKKLIERSLNNDLTNYESVFNVYMNKYLSDPVRYTKPYKHIKTFLLKAKKEGIKLFVFTNKPDSLANLVINKCFGPNLFDKVIGIKESTKVTKPCIEEFIKETKEFNIDLSNSLYFGDSDVDLFTGINLKVKGIYLTCWGYQDYKYLSSLKEKPTKYLFKPKELLSLL